MSGKVGEDTVYDLTEKMSKLGFETNHSCGLHVHLDANNLIKTKGVDMSEIPYGKSNFGDVCFQPKLFNLLKSFGMTVEDIFAIHLRYSDVNMKFVSNDGLQKIPAKKIVFKDKEKSTAVYFYQLENYYFLAKKSDAYNYLTTFFRGDGQIEGSKDMLPDRIIALSHIQNDRKLKSIFYAYTVFSDVFLSMLPDERRINGQYSSTGRDYCQKLIDRISPFDIEKCRNTEELEALWLKTKNKNEIAYKKRDKYDESRYYGVNFHSLFAKYGTVEIRWHEGTLSPKKILYWVAIHQHILRTLEEDKVDIKQMGRVLDMLKISEKIEYFFQTFKFPSNLEKYMRHRIEFFNNNQN